MDGEPTDEIPTRRTRRLSETSQSVIATAHESIVLASRFNEPSMSSVVLRALGDVYDVGAASSGALIRELRAELARLSARVEAVEADLAVARKEVLRLRSLMRSS